MVSSLHGSRPLGKVLRAPLGLIPEGAVFPILTGPNRGMKWVAGTGTHAAWIGHYELHNARHIASLCREGMTVFDVGAHAGYFTLLMARLVGPTGQVFAFEPDPANYANLARHIKINNLGNVELINAAASSETGHSKFAGSQHVGRLDPAGGKSVRTVKLSDYPLPDLLKMDIEGGEMAVLNICAEPLFSKHARLFIELHGTCKQEVPRMLSDCGYKVIWHGTRHIDARP